MVDLFYIGQSVGCIVYGEGRVVDIVEGSSHPIAVKIITGAKNYYRHDGAWAYNARPTLYPIKQYRELIERIEPPKSEPTDILTGGKVYAWNDGNEICRGYLLNINPDTMYPFKIRVWGAAPRNERAFKHCVRYDSTKLPEQWVNISDESHEPVQ
jgi:hypothetical protein